MKISPPKKSNPTILTSSSDYTSDKSIDVNHDQVSIDLCYITPRLIVIGSPYVGYYNTYVK